MFRYWISSQENDKLEAISSARVAAKFHLDLIALTAKIAAADRNSKPWSKAAMKSPGQRRGTGRAGASIPRWRERGHSRICHPSVDDAVDRFPWRVISPHGNVRK